MSARRTHVLNLGEGDLYRYKPDGEVFRVAVVKDDKGKVVQHLAQHADGTKSQLWAVVEYEGCFIYPVETEGSDADHVS